MRRVARLLVRDNAACVLSLALALGLLGLVGCERPAAPAAPAASAAPTAVDVGVVQAWTSPVERTLQLVGSTRAVDTVSITAQATGTVSWIGFDDEALVEAGTLLVRLDDRRVAADTRASEARVERLKLRLERIENAFGLGAANSSELDDARTALAEATAELERNQAILSDYAIVAPFDGRITRRLVSLGALVSPGTAVAVLNRVDPIEVSFAVPEANLAELQHGLAIQARTAAYGDRPFVGVLEGIGAVIDPLSRSAEVYAKLPNEHGLLRPGMFMVVRLVLDARADAVLVPESALVVEGTRTEVFIVNEQGTVDRQRVKIGKRFPGIVEIAEGVAPGDTVVTSGVLKLRQGTLVRAAPDQNLAALGVIAGLPLSEQPTMKASGLSQESPSGASDQSLRDGEG